jgi:hypothetical protein
MSEVGFPMYVLAAEDSGDVLITAEDLEGFFVAPEAESPGVVFVAAHEVNRGWRRAEDAVLGVVNHRREKIGEYYIGLAVIGGTGIESPEGKTSSVWFQFFGNYCEYFEAIPIWRRWASGPALGKDEWFRWPASSHDAWLHVVQNSWFSVGRSAARYGVNEVVDLDGALISTPPGFFCALGEAVNGPGGYY